VKVLLLNYISTFFNHACQPIKLLEAWEQQEDNLLWKFSLTN
jgi:hypothetical protein